MQFVRKVSGFRKPSKANQAAFDGAVRAVAAEVQKLLGALESRGGNHERNFIRLHLSEHSADYLRAASAHEEATLDVWVEVIERS